MDVVALELDRPTADFTQGPAMTEAEVVAALAAGWAAVDPHGRPAGGRRDGDRQHHRRGGAGACAVTAGRRRTGSGAAPGSTTPGWRARRGSVGAGLAANPGAAADPLEALRCLGGRELAAMAGAIARARAERIPVILDGFICTAAAGGLERAVPGALDHAVAGPCLGRGRRMAALLEALGKAPLLSLGMRLGEGSGAALAIGVLKGAVACHSGMATFAEAGVAAG